MHTYLEYTYSQAHLLVYLLTYPCLSPLQEIVYIEVVNSPVFSTLNRAIQVRGMTKL